MDLSKLLHLLPQGTKVRIKVAGSDTIFAGQIGPRKIDALLHDVYSKAIPNPYVYAIWPLYHAEEIYIECW